MKPPTPDSVPARRRPRPREPRDRRAIDRTAPDLIAIPAQQIDPAGLRGHMADVWATQHVGLGGLLDALADACIEYLTKEAK